MNAVGFHRPQVTPPLTVGDKADAAEFHDLAVALLRELAQYDPHVAARARALGLDTAACLPPEAAQQAAE